MAKCNTCNKIITKKSPVLECSRCQKIVHATNLCTGLSNKQLTALKVAENLEWTCNDCNQNSSKRKSFVTLAELDDDEDEEVGIASPSMNVDKLLDDIRKQVTRIITEEMQSVSKSVQFCSDKVDDMTESIEALTSKIKDLERKQVQLENNNKCLELKTQALEQHIREMDQQLLSSHVEIAGIPESNDLELPLLVKDVVEKLNVSRDEVVSVKRLQVRKTGASPVLVKLRAEPSRCHLLLVARTEIIRAGSLMPNLAGPAADEKIFIREALTPYYKNLLWQAKQDLKGTFKFVWFKEGCVLARKNENAKVHRIRSKGDLQDLLV